MEPTNKPTEPPDEDDSDDGTSVEAEAGWDRVSGKIQLGKLDRNGVIVIAIVAFVILGIFVCFAAVKIWGPK